MDFGTVLTAMVTPFDTDGNIDFPTTRLLIEHLLDNGTEGIVVAGTTGESPSLSDSEKLELFKYVIEVVNKRVPAITGTRLLTTSMTYLNSSSFSEYESVGDYPVVHATTIPSVSLSNICSINKRFVSKSIF